MGRRSLPVRGLGAVLFVLLGLFTLSAPSAAAGRPLVTVVGAPGTFGGVTAQPGGGTRAVPGWQFLPGQAAYQATVASDGTVVIANEPQTDNQAVPTASEMAITSFAPRTGRFSNIVIPTSAGIYSAPGGADVSAVQATASGVEFVSSIPFHGWNLDALGTYPSIGYLKPGGGSWMYAAQSSRTASQLSSTLAGSRACPPVLPGLADCHGPSAMALLPRSHDTVVAQYFHGGGLFVLDPSSRVVARYAFAGLHPREVDADPTSRPGDERFVVVFDTDSGPFELQELRFDASRATLTPVSPITTVGSGVETATFDSRGDLWVAESVSRTLTGGPLVAYLAGHPLGGTPDLAFAQASSLGLVRSLVSDPDTGSVLAATLSGYLLAVSHGPSGWQARPVVDLGLGRLVDRNQAWIGPRQGAVDAHTHTLWLPIQQLCRDTCGPQLLDQWLEAIDLGQLVGPAHARACLSRARHPASLWRATHASSSCAGPHAARRAGAHARRHHKIGRYRSSSQGVTWTR